jgi:hypothetical protein
MYHLFRRADRQDNERWSMPTFAYEIANVVEKHEMNVESEKLYWYVYPSWFSLHIRYRPFGTTLTIWSRTKKKPFSNMERKVM